METKNMLYIVSEYASQGEIFGKSRSTYSGKFDCVSEFEISTFFLSLSRKRSEYWMNTNTIATHILNRIWFVRGSNSVRMCVRQSFYSLIESVL